MPAKKTPQKQSKSDFIRSQPATLSAAEVVAKGKAAGVTILPGLVYEVRRTTKAKKALAAKPVAAVATRSAKMSKADFVRSRSTLSPKEIVEKARAEGLTFEVQYVHNVRGYDKTAGKKKRAAKKASKPAVTNGSGPSTTASSAETLLKALGAEIGLGRAIELLQGERARVSAILRG